jgi:hypothetical protein
MIKIYVEGQELVISRGTTMTVELNNTLFANPDVEGDVSFTFSIPLEGNERLLGFPNMPQCGGARKMPCTVYCNGSLSWNGNLVVQKASSNTLSAALVINPYPDGFGKRSLNDNEDDIIEISSSLQAHDTAWKQFLAASVNNQDVKFAPFYNDDGYGSDNDSWGFWRGHERRKVVNELFFDDNGNLIASDTTPFSKAHNGVFELAKDDSTAAESGENGRMEYTETNQLAFTPQIRVAKVFEIWCRNAGYSFTNHLGDDLNKTFMQSQKSLDGTKAQYDIGEKLLDCVTDGMMYESTTIPDRVAWFYKLNAFEGNEFILEDGGTIQPLSEGWYELTLTCLWTQRQLHEQLKLDSFDETTFGWIIEKFNSNIREFGYKVAIYKDFENFGSIHENSDNILMYETLYSYKDIGNKRTHNPELQLKIHYTSLMIEQGIRVVAFRREKDGIYGYKLKTKNIPMKISLRKISADEHQHGFNIFRRQFRITETLPDITNSAFIKTMIETFGMCYFISGKEKKVEIVPYTMLRNSGSIDLTEWELTRETEVQTPEETLQTFRLTPLKDDGYNENLRIADTVTNELPDPYENHEHLTLLVKTNTLYLATLQEHAEKNWVEAWEEYCGNPDRLETGSGDENNREPNVRIPHQRFAETSSEEAAMANIYATAKMIYEIYIKRGYEKAIATQMAEDYLTVMREATIQHTPEYDSATREKPQLMVADFTISSDLYNTGEKPSDIILTQYRGLRKREYFKYEGGYVWNEVMLPVWNGEFSLTAKGENSLGEKYVKPVLELANHKTITYKLRLPANMMQPVENLLRPSELPPERQTRFIVIRNVKTVPKKITFQIDNDRDDTVLCQIEAVKVY